MKYVDFQYYVKTLHLLWFQKILFEKYQAYLVLIVQFCDNLVFGPSDCSPLWNIGKMLWTNIPAPVYIVNSSWQFYIHLDVHASKILNSTAIVASIQLPHNE